jgi:hypothetical protein
MNTHTYILIYIYTHTHPHPHPHPHPHTYIPPAGIFGVFAYRRILRSSVAAIGLSAASKACQQLVKHVGL